MKQKGVIAPTNKTTDCCSPAFFVPKGDKIKVRLGTDYTELNKHIQQPIHPFSSTKEILQAVPKNAKVFCNARCCTWILPSGSRRRKLQDDYILQVCIWNTTGRKGLMKTVTVQCSLHYIRFFVWKWKYRRQVRQTLEKRDYILTAPREIQISPSPQWG